MPGGRFTTGRALVGAVITTTLLGVLLSVGVTARPEVLDGVRESVHVIAGVLFFGAGLLQLSTWRVDREPNRAGFGIALLVFGFLASRLTALGSTLHADETAAVLSPWTATAVALLALSVSGLRGRFAVPAIRPTLLVATCVVLLVLVQLVVPVAVERGATPPLDLPVAAHLALELAVAALWFAFAVRVGNHGRRTGDPIAAVRAALLRTVGVVWLMRATAVAVDVQAWSVAAAALLALTGLVVLAGAATAFAGCADAGEQRLTATEEALETIARAFTSLDAERRSVTHDARNTVLVLRLASQTLLDHGEELDVETRVRLRTALAEEVSRLAALLDRPAQPDAVVTSLPMSA